MNVCGVICEYNPFHNGHLFHLAQARRQSGADYVVCVMSGDVTQRGTFARHDKFLRTRMALQGGADLVLQLPTRFSCAAADEFAAGGVALLSALGVVTHLSFGCEPETLPVLLPAARALRAETPAFRDALASALQSGIPYPAAYAKAAEDTLAPDGTAELLSQPNAALALQYLRVLPPDITPVPVARTGRRHDEPGLHPLAGASAIRRALEDGLPASDIAPSLPFSRAVAEAEQRGFVHPENALELPALWRLRSLSAAELARLAGVSEGLENRIAQAARQAGDRETWLSLCKTRRYTRARLSRIFHSRSRRRIRRPNTRASSASGRAPGRFSAPLAGAPVCRLSPSARISTGRIPSSPWMSARGTSGRSDAKIPRRAPRDRISQPAR